MSSSAGRPPLASSRIRRHLDTLLDDGHWWRSRIVIAAVLPPLVFLVLRPESFGLTPNALDPFFYTGYAINFDDIMRAIGDGHYFVSRWSAYLPSRLLSDVFGPFAGRLVLRWVVASIVLLALWRLGRSLGWRRRHEIIAGGVVLAMPLFARSFLTDYVEWVVVSAGIVLVTLCVRSDIRIGRSAWIGVLAAVIAIANPLALTMVVIPIGVHMIVAHPASRRVYSLLVMSAAAGAVVLSGLIFFRIAYDIPNVYRPTVDFMRAHTGFRDPFLAPDHAWLATYWWIYIPAILLLAVAGIPALRRQFLVDRTTRAATIILAVQYVYQWADQFIRHGSGLELSYYWAFITPAICVATAVLAGSVPWRRGTTTALACALIGAILVGRFTSLEMGGILALAGLLVVMGVAGAGLGRRFADPAIPVAFLVVVVFLLQLVPPRASPSMSLIDINPLYRDVFYSRGDSSDRLFDAAVFLERQLDGLDSDDDLFFVPVERGSFPIAIYGPHVTGHLLEVPSDGTFDAGTRGLLLSRSAGRIVVFGPPPGARRALEAVRQVTDASSVRLDTADPSTGFRLVVVDVPSAATHRVTWPARDLPGQTGRVAGDDRIARPAIDAPAFLTFGPYVSLDERVYRATLTYSSSASPGEVVGGFDVVQNGVTHGAIPLRGTGGRTVSTSVRYSSPGAAGWEFRTQWNGTGTLRVRSVANAPAG